MYIDELDSTNKFLKDNLANSKPPPEGTVIMAGKQTLGRGQNNTAWISEPYKNITASILLYPTFLDTRSQFYLSRVVCLALIDTLSLYLAEKPVIKWPNDIYVNGKKICGVLIENTLSGNRIRSSVIGIGLNVNQETFPDDIGAPTSIKLLLHHHFDLQVVLADLCKNLEAKYLLLRSGQFEKIHTDYDMLLFRRELKCLYQSDGKTFTGTIKNTTKEGLLLVQTTSGLKSFDLKQISYNL